jgi:hypothetical protein
MSWITADSIRSKILTPQVLERRGFGEDGTPLAGNDKTFGNRISSLAKQNTAAAERQASEDTKNVRRRAIKIRESSNDKGANWIKMSPTDPRRTETVNIGTELTNFDTQHPNIFEFLTTGNSDSLKTSYIITKGTGGTGPSGLQWINSNDSAKEGTDFTTVLNNAALQADIRAKRETIINNNPTADLSTHEFDFTAEEWAKYQITGLTYDHYVIVDGDKKYQPLQPKATKAHSINRYHIVDGDVDENYNQIANIGTEYVLVGDDTVGDPNIAKDLDKDIEGLSDLNYGDWFSDGNYVWVLSRSTEDERQYQRDNEKDVRELRRRCIRIREKKTDSSKIGQIWIKMKKYDPRRTDTVNIGNEVTPDSNTINVLENDPDVFDETSEHAYYGKFFVVDSKIDSEHNYVDRDSPTGFEYVFDEGNVPTILGVTLAYGDYYDPDSTNDNGFVWVVSRSTEDEREYQRVIEKEVKELRRSCIRHRENSTTIGQIWVKEPVDAVEIQGYKYSEISIDAKLKEIFANKSSVFALGHDYYRQFFVVDSHIDSEHDYVVRNSPSGITYVFNNMTMPELSSFNTTLDYGNYVKLGNSISEITVINTALDYKEGQTISLVITPPNGITPIITASVTITVPVGGINNTTPVSITEGGVGYGGDTTATVISSQAAQFNVIVGEGDAAGKIIDIIVSQQGVGYADGELNLTITDSDNTPTITAQAKVNVPETGIIDVGSIGSDNIINQGAGYTPNVSATLFATPGTPLEFIVTETARTDRFVVSRSTEVMREYMKSIEVSREAAREMYRLQEGISLLNNLEAWDPENRIGRIWIYVSDDNFPSTDKEITDYDYPGFPNSLIYGVPSGYSWYRYNGDGAPTGVAVLFNNATVANGGIDGITVSQEGSGYTPGEIIDLTITDTGGTGASATVTVAADGSISADAVITVTNGTGYSENVSVSLDKPDPFNGTEVSFNVTVTNGDITAITVDQAGSGYTNVAGTDATLVITDNEGNGASARVTVNFDGTINAVQITNNGSGYSANVTVSCKTNNTQVLLEKSELATALALRQDFTPSEWNSFSISGLTVNHYVAVVETDATNYYKPVPGKLIYTSEELDQYGLNTIDSTYWVRNTATTAPRNSGYFIPSYHINQNYKNLQYPSNVLNNILGRVWLKVDKIPTDGNAYTSADLKGELDKGILSFTLDRLDELGIVSAYSSGLNWKGVNTLPSSGILFTDSGLTSLLDGNGEVDSVKTITKSEWDGLAIDIGLTENHYIIGSNSKYYKPVNKNTLNNTHYIVGATGYYYVPGYWVNSTFKDAYYPLVDPSQ